METFSITAKRQIMHLFIKWFRVGLTSVFWLLTGPGTVNELKVPGRWLSGLSSFLVIFVGSESDLHFLWKPEVELNRI